MRIDAGGESRTVDLPAVTDGPVGGAPVAVPVQFAPLTGSDVRVTVTGIRPVTTLDYHERQPSTMPVAIAEVGLPGVQRAALPTQLPATCRDDLLTVDGRAVGVQLTGTTAAAAAGQPLDLAPCPAAAAPRVSRSMPGTTSCARRRARAPGSTSTAWCSARTPAAPPWRWANAVSCRPR